MTNDMADLTEANDRKPSAATAAMLRNARDSNVFQLESSGMRQLIADHAPELEGSEYRPGVTRPSLLLPAIRSLLGLDAELHQSTRSEVGFEVDADGRELPRCHGTSDR